MMNEKHKDGKHALAFQRAQSAVLSRDYALAIRLYNKILTTDPDNLEALSKLGFVYVRSGNDEKALKIYLMIQKKNPTNFDTLNSLGGIYRRLGRYDKSIAVLEKALQSGGNVETIHYNMGFTYKFMGQFSEAAECFETVIDANPNDVLAYNHLGSIEDLRGNPEKAQAIFSRGLQIDPNHPILHYNAALSFISQKKYEQAKKHFQAALRAKPGWEEVMDEYVRLLNLMNNKGEAKKILEQAVILNPSNIQPHINLGDFYTEKADYPKAEKSYISALEIDSENKVVSSSLAGVYEKQEKTIAAVEIFDRLEKLDPDDNQLALRYAKSLLSLRRLTDAMMRIEKVQDKEPENIDAFNVLAQYSILNGEKKKAQDCLKYIKELDPNAISHLIDNAKQFTNIRDFSAAKKLLKEYLEKKPNDSKAWSALGLNYKEMEQYRDALLAWQRCLELDKENTAIFEEVVALSSYLNSDLAAMRIISNIVNSLSNDSNLENIENILVARENALKNTDNDDNATDSDENPYMLELGYPESDDDDDNEEEESFEGLLSFEANSSEGDFPEDYDPLILEESEEFPTEEDEYENEHFDLASLVSGDEPYDFDPESEKPDLFDGSESKQYDPIEEQEYLGVDGSGFEDDDIDDDDDEDEIKTVPLAKSPMLDTPIEEPVPEPMPAPPLVEKPPPIEIPFDDEILSPEIEPDSDIINDEYSSEPEFEKSANGTDELPDNLVFEDEPDLGLEKDKEALPDMPEDSVESEENKDLLLEQEDLACKITADDFDNPLDSEIPEGKATNSTEFNELLVLDQEYLEEDSDEIFATLDEILMKKVKEVLNKSFSSPPVKDFKNTVEMFDLLRRLCPCLPAEKKDMLFSNLDNAKLNYVVERLSGKPGLLAAADALHLRDKIQYPLLK